MVGLYVGLVSSVVAIILVLLLIKSVVRKEEGTDVMKKIARQIQLGASTFLKREYTYIAVVVGVIAVVMLITGKYFGYRAAISFEAMCGTCGEPNHTRAKKGLPDLRALRMKSIAASTVTMELSPSMCTTRPLLLK